MVSIVLPTKNRSQLLKKAVGSVLLQTYEDWELILVDDGSTDDTPAIISEFAVQSPKIKPLRNPESQGLPKALNIGFRAASGDLLTWTSDDNLYKPEALQKMTYALAEGQGAGAAYASMEMIGDSGAVKSIWHARAVEVQPILPWFGACFMYRRSVYEGVGDYNPEFRLAEDLDYWIRIRQQFSCIALDQVLYQYLEHDQSLSATQADAATRMSAAVVRSHLDNLPWLTKRTRAETYLGLANDALVRGNLQDLKMFTKEAIVGAPDLVLRRFKRGIAAAITGRLPVHQSHSSSK